MIKKGAKGDCLAVLMADAGWHGTDVTGLSSGSKIPSQVPQAEECYRKHAMLRVP